MDIDRARNCYFLLILQKTETKNIVSSRNYIILFAMSHFFVQIAIILKILKGQSPFWATLGYDIGAQSPPLPPMAIAGRNRLEAEKAKSPPPHSRGRSPSEKVNKEVKHFAAPSAPHIHLSYEQVFQLYGIFIIQFSQKCDFALFFSISLG